MTRNYRSNNGVAYETRVKPSPETAEYLASLFGSLAAAARAAVDLFTVTLGSFGYLVDPTDEDCPFSVEEIGTMQGLFVRPQALDAEYMATMSDRITHLIGDRFGDRPEIERLMIVTHLWLKRWRGAS